jgi:thiamine biosynthesis lipoprotein
MLASCGSGRIRYQGEFDGLFDTRAELVGYASSIQEFNSQADIIYGEMLRYSQLFDIYSDYDKISNLKTVNANAGIAPVKVDPAIIDLLRVCVEFYHASNGKVNVAMGPVLSIWHKYREEGLEDPASARVPSASELESASLLCSIDDVVIDGKNQTVFLKKPGMSLDVGAIAKGYAAGEAMEKAAASGMDSMLFNMGGNIVCAGKPMDGTRDRWGVGVQDPALEMSGFSNILDTVFVNGQSVVTSGGYQRYYTVDGVNYSHIIDPDTLMPAIRHLAVTVLHPDSCIADALSTALFIMDEASGRELLSKFGGSAIWVSIGGEVTYTDGYKAVSKSYGGYSGAD